MKFVDVAAVRNVEKHEISVSELISRTFETDNQDSFKSYPSGKSIFFSNVLFTDEYCNTSFQTDEAKKSIIGGGVNKEKVVLCLGVELKVVTLWVHGDFQIV